MSNLNEEEVLRIYAKLNAQDHLITACLATLVSMSDNPAQRLETIRSATMDLADRQQDRLDDPNPAFARQGLLLMLEMVAQVFEVLKKSIESEGPAG